VDEIVHVKATELIRVRGGGSKKGIFLSFSILECVGFLDIPETCGKLQVGRWMGSQEVADC